jgi:hypothetical protein
MDCDGAPVTSVACADRYLILRLSSLENLVCSYLSKFGSVWYGMILKNQKYPIKLLVIIQTKVGTVLYGTVHNAK